MSSLKIELSAKDVQELGKAIEMGLGLQIGLQLGANVNVSAIGFDPEANLGEPDLSIPSGTFTAPDDGTNDTVFAMDFTGLDGSGGGRICSIGGATTGMSFGFKDGGAFVVRAGSGGAEWPVGTSYIEIASGLVDGDGTLVVEVSTSSQTNDIRAWWNGVLVGQSSVDGQNAGLADAWGDATPLFMTASGSASPTGTNFTLTQPANTSFSNMRVYLNSLVT